MKRGRNNSVWKLELLKPRNVRTNRHRNALERNGRSNSVYERARSEVAAEEARMQGIRSPCAFDVSPSGISRSPSKKSNNSSPGKRFLKYLKQNGIDDREMTESAKDSATGSHTDSRVMRNRTNVDVANDAQNRVPVNLQSPRDAITKKSNRSSPTPIENHELPPSLNSYAAGGIDIDEILKKYAGTSYNFGVNSLRDVQEMAGGASLAQRLKGLPLKK